MQRRTLIPALAIVAIAAAGCGHTEEEWQVQIDKNQRLQQENQTAVSRLATAAKEIEEAQHKLDALSKQGEAGDASEDKKRAAIEFEQRAKQLEATKLRLLTLRKRLEEQAKQGVAVKLRKNRIVVSIPADALFDKGRETITKDGQALLKKVGEAVKADPTLASRELRVAAHTDDKPPKGKDNLTLSVLRAREALVFLSSEKGGGLAGVQMSATGYADADPIASNESDEGKAKNRRIEIIFVPTQDEVLDLRSMAQ